MYPNDILSNLPENLDYPPIDEPLRQMYFIRELKKVFLAKEDELGRKLTYAVVTFGCQMNAHDSEKLEGILATESQEKEESGDDHRTLRMYDAAA